MTIARAFAFSALLISAPVLADQATMDVSANIKGTCRIDSIQSVDFGDLEQGTTAADKTAPGSITYWCTKGVAYTITLGPGTNPSGSMRRMKGQASTNSSEFLAYELASQSATSGTGRGPQTPEAHTVRGTVKGADYNLLSVGGFKDTVIITVTP